MKTKLKRSRNFILWIFSCLVIVVSACTKDEDVIKTKTPLWVYNAGADPYQSKPCVSGDNVVFYASDENVDDGVFLYCVNRNTGNLIWKAFDTLAIGSVSPVIYNNLILAGGANPHALNLENGSRV